MENKIRHTLNEIYFGKTRDIVNGLRSVTSLEDIKARDKVQAELASQLAKRTAVQ